MFRNMYVFLSLPIFMNCRICVTQNGEKVDPSLCDASIRPSSHKKCNTIPCVVYVWAVGSWSPCNRPCDAGLFFFQLFCTNLLLGVQQRKVRCRSSLGKFVKDFHCSENKPLTSAVCNEQPCDFCDANTCSSKLSEAVPNQSFLKREAFVVIQNVVVFMASMENTVSKRHIVMEWWIVI